MRSEGSLLGFIGGERWGEARITTTNYQSPRQGQPGSSGHPALVVTDNAIHRPWHKGTKQCPA
ncbi:MAG: hypothetical protein GY832_30185 [Chloroflexi bacterium]|nr:hypothetical protein [Chloroflexota bacterium]